MLEVVLENIMLKWIGARLGNFFLMEEKAEPRFCRDEYSTRVFAIPLY